MPDSASTSALRADWHQSARRDLDAGLRVAVRVVTAAGMVAVSRGLVDIRE